MPSRLITPSQLSLFSISPGIGAWWEELQAQKLFEGSKPAVSELDQQLFADGLRQEQVLLSELEKAGHSMARLPGKQTDDDATREAMAQGLEFIHQASLCKGRCAAVPTCSSALIAPRCWGSGAPSQSCASSPAKRKPPARKRARHLNAKRRESPASATRSARGR